MTDKEYINLMEKSIEQKDIRYLVFCNCSIDEVEHTTEYSYIMNANDRVYFRTFYRGHYRNKKYEVPVQHKLEEHKRHYIDRIIRLGYRTTAFGKEFLAYCVARMKLHGMEDAAILRVLQDSLYRQYKNGQRFKTLIDYIDEKKFSNEVVEFYDICKRIVMKSDED